MANKHKQQREKADKKQTTERALLAAMTRIKELEAEHFKISRFMLDVSNYSRAIVTVLAEKKIIASEEIETAYKKIVKDQQEETKKQFAENKSVNENATKGDKENVTEQGKHLSIAGKGSGDKEH